MQHCESFARLLWYSVFGGSMPVLREHADRDTKERLPFVLA